MVALIQEQEPRGCATGALPRGLRAVRRGAEHGLQYGAVRLRLARTQHKCALRGPGSLSRRSAAGQLRPRPGSRVRRDKARGHGEEVARKVADLREARRGLPQLAISALCPGQAA